MNKTLTINLNKTVFNIDEEAYDLLQAYLADVNEHFKNEPDKAEIISDIEARIAELFTEKLGKIKNVITVNDVNDIVYVMGKPSQFSEDEEDTSEGEKTTSNEKKEEEYTYSGSKRFYLDPDNGLLGGVCSGLGAYLGWDVTLIRILLVALVFFGLGSVIPIYIVVWIVAPRATTTAQKMAMRGEVVNIETIKNKMKDAKNYVNSDEFKSSAEDVGSKFGHFFQSVFKVLMTLLGVIFTVVGVVLASALIFALLIILVQPDVIMVNNPDLLKIMEGISTEKITLLILGVLFIIGAPIFALIYWSIRARSTERATSNTPFWVALILWFAGIFMFMSVGSETFKIFNNNIKSFDNWDLYDPENNPEWKTENRNITASFNAVEIDGVMNVEFTHQKENSVSISTIGKYLPQIKTEVEGGVLKIRTINNLIKPNIKIEIGVDSLTGVSASGATKINFTNAFPAKYFKADFSGASKGDLKFTNAKKIDIELSGASSLDMEGVTDSLVLESSGSSKIDTEDISAKYVKIDLSGVSKADVTATETIDGDISGTSKIDCYGNPKNKNVSTSGLSKIDYNN